MRLVGASTFNVHELVEAGPYPTIQNNRQHGFRVQDGSYLQVAATIQNNDASGVSADLGSNLRVVLATITGNGADGVTLRSSTARMGPGLTITNNAGHGVAVGSLAFMRLTGGNSITGNTTGPDVHCGSATAVTAGAVDPPGRLGGGSTNCTDAP